MPESGWDNENGNMVGESDIEMMERNYSGAGILSDSLETLPCISFHNFRGAVGNE